MEDQIISPFAAIMPMFDLEEENEFTNPPGTSGPAPCIVSLADLASVPSLPSAAAGGPQGLQLGSMERQHSLRYAASAAASLLPPHSSLASSIGSWVAALLRRGSGSSSPAPGGDEGQSNTNLAGVEEEEGALGQVGTCARSSWECSLSLQGLVAPQTCTGVLEGPFVCQLSAPF